MFSVPKSSVSGWTVIKAGLAGAAGGGAGAGDGCGAGCGGTGDGAGDSAAGFGFGFGGGFRPSFIRPSRCKRFIVARATSRWCLDCGLRFDILIKGRATLKLNAARPPSVCSGRIVCERSEPVNIKIVTSERSEPEQPTYSPEPFKLAPPCLIPLPFVRRD